MPQLSFRGYVHPKELSVTVSNFHVQWALNENKTECAMHVAIIQSNIEVICDLQNSESERDFTELYIKVMDVTRCAVDLVSFKTGWGLTVIFDSLVDCDGAFSKLAPKDERLEKLCQSYSLSNEDGEYKFSDMLSLAVCDPKIFFALNDLIQAIILPHYSTVNCARAVDSIRNMIAPGLQAKKAWPKVQSHLNVDASYLYLILHTSKGPRHGDRVRVPGVVTTEITCRSWVIMDRFFEYRKRGNQQLSLTDYPILKG